MIELLTYRIYGQPKISKPKLLKGIKPSFFVWHNKRKVQVYLMGDDVVVYFPDLFSRLTSFPDVEDMTLPTAALQKKYGLDKRHIKGFIYADGWCVMYNRNEGYVMFKGLVSGIRTAGYLPALEYDVETEFCMLSKADKGFCSLSQDLTCSRSAEYCRVINDIITTIKLKWS